MFHDVRSSELGFKI